MNRILNTTLPALRRGPFSPFFAVAPLAAIVYTDIAVDGMLSGPNLGGMREMREAVRLPVVASGGVGSAADVARLAEIPMDGCIIGKALYEGTVTLADALAAAATAGAV